jgi:Ribbon-helix-helix protein, copG family
MHWSTEVFLTLLDDVTRRCTLRGMDRNTKDTTLSYRVPRKLKQELQTLANADRRNLSDFIRLALEELVEAKRKEGKRR